MQLFKDVHLLDNSILKILIVDEWNEKIIFRVIFHDYFFLLIFCQFFSKSMKKNMNLDQSEEHRMSQKIIESKQACIYTFLHSFEFLSLSTLAEDYDIDFKYDPLPKRFIPKYGGISHPGIHGKTNDDKYFLFEGDSSEGHYVAMGVFDGHYPTTGMLAATTACKTFQRLIKQPEFMKNLVNDTENTLTSIFKEAHSEIWKVCVVGRYEKELGVHSIFSE